MFRRRSGIPSNIRGIERFVWGLYSAPIHSLQLPVLGLCHFGTAWRGNCSSAAEGRPAVLSRDGTAEFDPKETSWNRGARQPQISAASPLRAVDHWTTRVGLRATGRDTL